MSLVIAIRGKESTKIVNGESRSVVPFVGTDREGTFAQMGIGLLYPDEDTGTFWGLVMPHALIRAWRGMKLLEQVERVEQGTLCSCWTIATSNVSGDDWRHMEALAGQFGSIDALEKIRAKVLASIPSQAEIDLMINAFREKGVDVDSGELTAEVKAGHTKTTPTINQVVEEESQRRKKYAKQEEEIKKPVPTEDSLAQFFTDLRIGNFIVGGGFGGYDIDWGHVELSKLDEFAKRDSLSEYCPDGFVLQHTTQGPESFVGDVAPGVTMYVTSFGEIENPRVTTADGTRFTFLSATFRDNEFHVKTELENGVGTPQVGEFTVTQLRMILEVEEQSNRTFFDRLTERVTGLFN